MFLLVVGLQGIQTILVEEQIFGLMLVGAMSYSVQLNHIVQVPPADRLAPLGIKKFLIIDHLATFSNVLLVATLYFVFE